MAHDVFISHAAEDRTAANAVCATLEANRIRCWIAPRDVLPSVRWADAIVEAINESRIMVLVFTSHSNNSDQVMSEVEAAVNKGIPILPLKIEDVPLTKFMQFHIAKRHWLDALTPPLERHLQHLAETVSLLLSRERPEEGAGVEVPFKPPPVEGAYQTVKRWASGPLVRLAAGVVIAVAVVLLAVFVVTGLLSDVDENGRGVVIPPSTPSEGSPTVTALPSTPGPTPSPMPSSTATLTATPTGTQDAHGDGGAPPASTGDYAISLNLNCVVPGGELELSWTAESTKSYDTVKLYSKGTAYNASIDYVNVAGDLTGKRIVSAPSQPGDYEYRYMRGSEHLTRSAVFSVDEDCRFDGPLALSEGYAVSVSARCVAPGGELELSWTAESAKSYDNVKLYSKGAAYNASIDYANVAGDLTGKRIVSAPSQPGDYEYRYMRGSTHLAVSQPITVSKDCPQ